MNLYIKDIIWNKKEYKKINNAIQIFKFHSQQRMETTVKEKKIRDMGKHLEFFSQNIKYRRKQMMYMEDKHSIYLYLWDQEGRDKNQLNRKICVIKC